MLGLASLGTALLMSLAASTSKVRVTGLYRYAVKGLSGDPLSSVHLQTVGETFPDDRRYALLYKRNQEKFNGKDWLHKENFLCAFTDPALMASLQSHYKIVVVDDDDDDAVDDGDTQNGGRITQRILQIQDRATQNVILEDTNLATRQGRAQLGNFLSEKSGQKVVCVTADVESDGEISASSYGFSPPHRFQFGNTSSGYKQNKGDTRTIHIVNEKTVRALSDAIGIPLDARRFRPNIVIDGPPPFAEFDWVAHQQSLVTASGEGFLRALSRTVRCRGIGLDPFDESRHGLKELDIPGLLAKHFPEHGPFLGIYASLDRAPCSLSIGDELQISPCTDAL